MGSSLIPAEVGHRLAVGGALSDRKIRKKAGHRDELPEGHQSVLHACERRRPHGRGNGRIGAGDRGSQREERLEVLDRSMAERGIGREHYAPTLPSPASRGRVREG
jgi:hypothetical protein